MKIGIIADTHINKNIEKLEEVLYKHLIDVDMIIHAGDFNTIETIELIKNFKDFVGVYGNNDDENLKEILKESEIIEINGYKIGITHGHGKNKTTLDRAYEKFKDKNVDIIIFGHSHMPLVKTKNNVLLLNPGSITSKRRERYFSYILLEINRDEIKVDMRLFD